MGVMGCVDCSLFFLEISYSVPKEVGSRSLKWHEVFFLNRNSNRQALQAMVSAKIADDGFNSPVEDPAVKRKSLHPAEDNGHNVSLLYISFDK